MALLWWDSFDHYATGDRLEKWAYTNNNVVVGAYGRMGTNGLRLDGYINPVWLRSRYIGTLTTVTVGFGFEFEALHPWGYSAIVGLLDYGSYQITLTVGPDGSLHVWRGSIGTRLASTDPGLIHAGVYYYIEMQVYIDNAPNGTVEVWLNEDVVINAAGLDTQNTANQRITEMELGGSCSSGAGTHRYFRLDDLYVLDDSGAQCNDFLGDYRQYLLMPEGVGAHADWTPSAGANWQCVDDNPPSGDTDYNATNTVTDRDSFEMEDMPGGWSGTIQAVEVAINSRRDDAVAHQMEPSVRSGGVDYDGTAALITDDYSFYNLHAWELDPNTAAAWLVAGVNAMECGYELTV